MKLFVAALLLPLVAGECPAVAPVECQGADLLCILMWEAETAGQHQQEIKCLTM